MVRRGLPARSSSPKNRGGAPGTPSSGGFHDPTSLACGLFPSAFLFSCPALPGPVPHPVDSGPATCNTFRSARCRPRRFLISSSGRRRRSRPEPFRPANSNSPTTRACGASRRIKASEVTDFPEPDSPTRPRTSREAMVKLRSRTAVKGGAAGPRVGNSTVRCRTSSSGGTRHILAGQICLGASAAPERQRTGLALSVCVAVSHRLGLWVASCRSQNILRHAARESFEKDCARESRNNRRGRRPKHRHTRARADGKPLR